MHDFSPACPSFSSLSSFSMYISSGVSCSRAAYLWSSPTNPLNVWLLLFSLCFLLTPLSHGRELSSLNVVLLNVSSCQRKGKSWPSNQVDYVSFRCWSRRALRHVWIINWKFYCYNHLCCFSRVQFGILLVSCSLILTLMKKYVKQLYFSHISNLYYIHHRTPTSTAHQQHSSMQHTQ